MKADKTHHIESLLARAIDQLLPDVYEEVAFAPLPPLKEEDNVFSKPPRTVVYNSPLFRSLAACICFLLLCATGAYSYFSPVAEIGIEVNPSIALETNLYNRVIRATPRNEDAEAILNGLSLRNVDLDTAVSAIIGSMVQHNYFQDGTGVVKITVDSHSERRVMQLEQRLIQDVKDALPQDKKQVTVYTKNDVPPIQIPLPPSETQDPETSKNSEKPNKKDKNEHPHPAIKPNPSEQAEKDDSDQDDDDWDDDEMDDPSEKHDKPNKQNVVDDKSDKAHLKDEPKDEPDSSDDDTDSDSGDMDTDSDDDSSNSQDD